MTQSSTSCVPDSTPVHAHQINEKPVRFFCPPNGSVDLPWTSYEDLLSATGLSRQARRHFLEMTRKGEYGDALRTVRVPGGQTTIVPHYICQGIMGALETEGTLPQRFQAQYTLGSCAAFQQIHKDLSPNDRAQTLFGIVAREREEHYLPDAGISFGGAA
ncbi:hypothetical protein HKD27_08830 [Gluconobacter sp. R75690]|uniref:hypothetical protein n=1 Tax=unclassified Gluconobacter TaxID=2644261 RepID=UPI00188AC9BE|nr:MULTISPECIES: hypothetical protein [unclassified Gluconobacter]MBF0851021.1 hypothetical protein [Gluconobacter sp. R75690]MBF0879713.1 hypothetical protein [Gluconobacter sp. R75828]